MTTQRPSNTKDKDEENEKLDYILQALSHNVRRKIIELLAKKKSMTYTELMQECGIEDSGTFGFHLRRMRGLLKKNERGEYELNDLGWRAYKILCDLKGREAEKKEKLEEKRVYKAPTVVKFKGEPIVICDRIKLDLTREIVEGYFSRGKKLILKDILTLVIYPMPRELFDAVVESIYDCLTVYAPRNLADLVQERTQDILFIKVYDKNPPKFSLFHDIGSFISNLVSGVVSSIGPLITGTLTGILREIPTRPIAKELVLEEEIHIPKSSLMELNVNSGSIVLKHGKKASLRLWKVGVGKPKVNYDIRDHHIVLDVRNGKCEVEVPEETINTLITDVSGGAVSIKLNELEKCNMIVSRGWVKFSTKTRKPLMINAEINGGGISGEITYDDIFKGESRVVLSIDGGVSKLELKVRKETKISITGSSTGGVYSVKLDGNNVPLNYTEPGYTEAESRLAIKIDIMGGALSLNINRY